MFGLSSQSAEDQAELAQRLRLPTFTVDARRLYARVTLVVTDGQFEHALYPIFPPDQHAAQVLTWLRNNPAESA